MPAQTAHIEEERKKRQQAEAKKSPKKKGPKPLSASRYVGGPFAYYGLLIAVTILLGLGTLMVVSASSGEAIINQVSQEAAKATEAGKLAGLTHIKASVWGVGLKHILSIVLGIFVAWAMSRIRYRDYQKYLPLLGGVLLALLVAVAAFGYESNGARRWIIIMGQSIQPSEFAKPILFLIMVFAMYAVRKKGNSHMGDRDIWFIPAAFTGICVIMILMQPETGNVLVLFIGLLVAFLILELPLGSLKTIFGVLLVIVVGLCIREPYRAERILQYLGLAQKDPDAFWQIKQAQLAFGSGGLVGVGPGLSRQKYFYLPEAQNDFIIAIIGEELGLLGSFTVIASFIALLYCGFRIAYRATDSLGRALAGGAISMLVGQAILNIFSVTGLGPVTGKPLPFVTLGGSSMITSFMLLGIVLSVARFGSEIKDRVVGPADTQRKRTKKPVRGAATDEPTRAPRATAHASHEEQRASRRAQAKAPARNSRQSTNNDQEDFDEDSLEWRWDSGSHLSGPRRR